MGEAARDDIAVPRRLATDHHATPRAQHPEHLAERLLDVGDVMDHRMPDHNIERVVVVRQCLGVGRLPRDGEAEVLGVALGGLDHAR